MEFLDTKGNLIAAYPATPLPPSYSYLYQSFKAWLQQHKKCMIAVSRIRCVTAWLYLYLSDETGGNLDELIRSFLPEGCENMVALQRPDTSGWDMPKEKWIEFCDYGINNVPIIDILSC